MFLRANPAATIPLFWHQTHRPLVGRRSLAGMAAVAQCSFAFAQSSAPVVPAVVPAGVSTGAFVQGLIGLVVIIGLLLVTLAAIKRWGGQFGGVSTSGMKVISGLSVGARERILLIEVGETWLVVGVTASQIRTLHTLPKDSLPDLVADGSKPAFAQWLNKVMEQKKHDA